MSKRYIIIGSIPTNDPKSYGGTTILVRQMLDYFNEHDKEYIFIQANWYSGKFAFFVNYLYILFMLLKNIMYADIVLANVARNGAYYVSPVLLLLTKIFRKRFVFRIFGGGLLASYKRSNWMKKMLLRYVIYHADILFFEPKYLVTHYKKILPNTYWFPNVRKQPTTKRVGSRKYEKRFMFLGQIQAEKGIDEILAASQILDSSYSIELYGSVMDSKYDDSMWRKYPNVHYRGELKPIEVYDVLAQHDILLLPSYREGYPGAIIEAFGVGLPVIATNLESIQEMVKDECGILIEVKEAVQLAEAMRSVEERDYEKMSRSASEKFGDFEYEKVYHNIVTICEKENG